MIFGSKLNWQIDKENNQKLKKRLNREMKKSLWKNSGFESEEEYNKFMKKSKHIYIIE